MGFDANVEFLRIAFWQIILAAGPCWGGADCRFGNRHYPGGNFHQ